MAPAAADLLSGDAAALTPTPPTLPCRLVPSRRLSSSPHCCLRPSSSPCSQPLLRQHRPESVPKTCASCAGWLLPAQQAGRLAACPTAVLCLPAAISLPSCPCCAAAVQISGLLRPNLLPDPADQRHVLRPRHLQLPAAGASPESQHRAVSGVALQACRFPKDCFWEASLRQGGLPGSAAAQQAMHVARKRGAEAALSALGVVS